MITQTLSNDKSINSGVKPNNVKVLEEEEKRVRNPELKKALMELREEFKSQKEQVHNDYKAKIKPLKVDRDNNISELKESFLERRKMLFEKYGVNPNDKPKKMKPKNKKSKTGVPPVYKPAKPIKKTTPTKDIPLESIKDKPSKK
tara:strand:+ start:2225 stop:2659 length:435 start_codon:yes stop_codon:yes gene_type:complete